ncbi:hypothetical protein GCM10028777_16170 [Angustibacter speluncae]
MSPTTTGPALRPGVPAAAVVAVLTAALGISTAYGMLLLLPLLVEELGGSEADFGLVLSAAVVPAAAVLLWIGAHPRRVRPHWILVAATLGFSAAAGGAALVRSTWEPLLLVGPVLGSAWAVVYTVMPMIVDEMVTDDGHVTHFGYLTGTQQIGIGVGPVVAGWLSRTATDLRGAFVVAALLALVAAAATVVAAHLVPDARREPGAPRPRTGVLRSARTLAASAAGPWLVVITLFACLFTTMTQFQTTYAATQDLDYSVFFVSYTLAVIGVRFLVAPRVRRLDQTRVVAASVSVMLLAVAAFLVVGSNPVAYGAAAAVLGLGYGLALPTTQALAVSQSDPDLRPQVLPAAGLVFQTAILAFPLVVGAIVTSFGYRALFVVLVAAAAVQVGIAWRQAMSPVATRMRA